MCEETEAPLEVNDIRCSLIGIVSGVTDDDLDELYAIKCLVDELVEKVEERQSC